MRDDVDIAELEALAKQLRPKGGKKYINYSDSPKAVGQYERTRADRQREPVFPTSRRKPVPPLPFGNEAACSGLDPSVMTPASGRNKAALKNKAVQAAKAVCEQCPVKQECLDWAMSFEPKGVYERHGVLGGMSEWERVQEHRRRRETAAQARRQGG